MENLSPRQKKNRKKKVENKEAQLAAYKAELWRLNDDYWQHKQRLWRLEAKLPPGAMGEPMKHKKEPNWYLSDWLRRNCAGKGARYGRECGCCEKDRETERELGHGHCTSRYRRCIQSKECSAKDNVTVEDGLKVVPFDLVAYKIPYDGRMFRLYICAPARC